MGWNLLNKFICCAQFIHNYNNNNLIKRIRIREKKKASDWTKYPKTKRTKTQSTHSERTNERTKNIQNMKIERNGERNDIREKKTSCLNKRERASLVHVLNLKRVVIEHDGCWTKAIDVAPNTCFVIDEMQKIGVFCQKLTNIIQLVALQTIAWYKFWTHRTHNKRTLQGWHIPHGANDEVMCNVIIFVLLLLMLLLLFFFHRC